MERTNRISFACRALDTLVPFVPAAAIKSLEPATLGTFPVMKTLSETSRKRIFDCALYERHQRGQTLFNEIDSMSPIYFIVSGVPL